MSFDKLRMMGVWGEFWGLGGLAFTSRLAVC